MTPAHFGAYRDQSLKVARSSIRLSLSNQLGVVLPAQASGSHARAAAHPLKNACLQRLSKAECRNRFVRSSSTPLGARQPGQSPPTLGPGKLRGGFADLHDRTQASSTEYARTAAGEFQLERRTIQNRKWTRGLHESRRSKKRPRPPRGERGWCSREIVRISTVQPSLFRRDGDGRRRDRRGRSGRRRPERERLQECRRCPWPSQPEQRCSRPERR